MFADLFSFACSAISRRARALHALHRNKPTLARHMTEILGRNRSKQAQLWPKPTEEWTETNPQSPEPKPAPLWSKPDKFGRTRHDFGQTQVNFGRHRPNLGRAQPNLAATARSSVISGHPHCGRLHFCKPLSRQPRHRREACVNCRVLRRRSTPVGLLPPLCRPLKRGDPGGMRKSGNRHWTGLARPEVKPGTNWPLVARTHISQC